LKGICLICEKNREGTPIKEGHVIKLIKKIKQTFGIAKGSRLVICSSCMQEYTKRRTGFEKTIMIWMIIGLILALLLVVPPILLGDNILGILRSIGVSIVLIIVLLVLVGLVRYIPSLEKKTIKNTVKKIKTRKSKKKNPKKRKRWVNDVG